MSELRLIARDCIPRALLKAERYRLLNEPLEAESICRDVLAVDPSNAEAVVHLVLSLTDLFEERRDAITEARFLVQKLPSDHDRQYYAGVVEERWAKALLHAAYPAESIHDALRKAMKFFDAAARAAPEGNDDAILRWNSCVRIIERHRLASEASDAPSSDDMLDDDVPVR